MQRERRKEMGHWPYLLLVTLVALCLKEGSSQDTTRCFGKLDIVFVVDGSNSLRQANFDLQMASVRQLMSTLPISDDGIRVGIVIFSSEVEENIGLTGDKDFLMSKTFLYPDDATFTDKGITEAVNNFKANARNGDVRKLMMVITDGKSENPALTEQAANNAKKEGISIFALGVGSLVDEKELRNIASSPSGVLLTDGFTNIEASLIEATSEACVNIDPRTQPPTTDPTTTPVPVCNMGVRDIWLVVDVSATADTLSRLSTDGDFGHLRNGLDALMHVINAPSAQNDAAIMGLIEYSDEVQITVDPTVAASVSQTAAAISTLPNTIKQGPGRLDLALQTIISAPVNSSVSSYVIIVASEGDASDPSAVATEAQRLKDLGWILVTANVNDLGSVLSSDLQGVASGPSVSFQLTQYSDLAGVMTGVAWNYLCGEVKFGEFRSLCANSGHEEEGVSIIRHPTDCDKYVQCYYNPTGPTDLVVIRNCPMGLFYSDKKKICVHPRSADCPHDQCDKKCKSHMMEGSCRSYWDCRGGVSVPKCCPRLFAFIPGLGCQLDFTCNEYCGPQKCMKNEYCRKRPDWDDPAKYDLPLTGLRMLMPRDCFVNNFDVVDCECSAHREQECPALRQFDLSQGISLDNVKGISLFESNDTFSEDIPVGKDNAFNVEVPPLIISDEPFMLKVRFREAGIDSAFRRVLVSSPKKCEHGSGSLTISVELGFVQATIRTHHDRVAEVRVPTAGIHNTEFKEMTLRLADNIVTLSVKGPRQQYIAQVTAPPRVCFPCGLDIGGGDYPFSLEGFIQQLSVHSCATDKLY